MKIIKIPKEIKEISNKIIEKGYKAYIVGGCVRDLILQKKPKDWDIATDALPEEIQSIFRDSFYENNFGTVGVKTNSQDESLKVIEITTFRSEENYFDNRHPQSVKFVKSITEDLARRDFTINALAIPLFNLSKSKKIEVLDLFNGKRDLKNKIIRAVGNPYERFEEDALRLMRAVRLATELNFKIEEETFKAIKAKSNLLKLIAKERIRDEFIKIIMSKKAAFGINLLEEAGLLEYIIPELREGIGCTQNKHHIYTVFEHNLRALDYAASKNYSLEVRLASLLHDVGKPRSKRGEGENATFYNHEVIGARMTLKILDRLHFPKNIIHKVAHLVRYHLFYYNVGEVTESGVRRFLSKVGLENVDDLLKLREADRIGSGVPKAVPYKIRHLKFMIEKVRKDPITPKMLKVNGNDVMRILNIKPGPKIGWILLILLEEVLNDPQRNDKKYLEERIKFLGSLSDNDLQKMAEIAQNKKEEFESGIEMEMKKKYFVK